MKLIAIHRILDGKRLSLYQVENNAGGTSFPIIDVARVEGIATIVKRVGHDRCDPEHMAALVAYMWTQGYEIVTHSFYRGEEVGVSWPGNWFYVSAIFKKVS